MAEDHSQRIRSLFWQACDRRGEDRTKFLARQCQGDGELLREVQSLLDAHDQTESPLDRPAMEQLEAWNADGDFGPATEPDQHHGFPDCLGEFRLRQRGSSAGAPMDRKILTPGDLLLLTAAAPNAFPPHELLPFIQDGAIAWTSAFERAAANRVSSFVAALLHDEPLAQSVEDSIRADWRAHRMLQIFRMEAAHGQLRSIGEALGGAGIPMLLYKGLDFQTRCYSEACPRSFGDLDIIVRRDDVVRAACALEAAGYHPAFGTASLDYYRRFHLHAPYVHSADPRPVELHWALDSPFSDRDDPIPRLFDAAERHTALGPDVLRPAPLDALSLMAIHLDKHLAIGATLPNAEARLKSVIDESGLIWLLDVVRWMQTQSISSDGDAVLARTRELGAERALSIALRFAHDLDAKALPPWTRALADRLPHGRPLVSRLVYPDLSSGHGVNESGRRRRAFLSAMHPRLGFRPVRVLESLLPDFSVPGVPKRPLLARARLAARRVLLIAANLAAIWRARRQRHPMDGRRRRRASSSIDSS